MRSFHVLIVLLVMSLAACGSSSHSTDEQKIGKIDSFPATIEGRMEWRVSQVDQGSSDESDNDGEEETSFATSGPEVATGFIAAGDRLYSVEIDPALLTSAGIAQLGLEGVKVRATISAKSPMSPDSYVVSAVSRQ